MAKQRDGWLSRGMGGKAEGWVAKQRDGWLNWYSTFLSRKLSGFESRIFQKSQIRNISKGVANTLLPAKKNVLTNIVSVKCEKFYLACSH